MTENLYEILAIPTDADDREIKRAYHRLARELHPDKAASPEEAREVEERFALISAAYNTLKDPAKREEFDRLQKKDSASSTGGSPRPTATSRVLAAGRNRPAPPAAPQGAEPAAAKSPVSATPKGATTPSNGTKREVAIGITPERVAIAQKAYARGLQCLKDNNPAKAISFFEAAIQNNDQEPHYHAKLALTLIKEHKSATRAIEHAQRAVDLDAYNLEHRFALAFIYETIGSETNARRHYQEILRWDAGNLRAKEGLAALGKKGKRAPFGISFGGGGNGSSSANNGRATASADPSATGGFLQQLLGRFKK
jgi:tetratricopeptide (TPR) repeat protein